MADTAPNLDDSAFDNVLYLREIDRRITVLETEQRHLATKAWVLTGVVGGMISATLIALAVVQLFWQA